MAGEQTSKAVGERSPESQAILDRVTKVRALMSGTDGMVAAGETYLPKFPVEDDDDYDARLKGSWLFNTTRKTIRDNRDRIMEKPVTLADDNGDAIVEMSKNIDMNGRDLSNFTKDLIYDALQAGVSWIMVDAPSRTGSETKEEAKTQNLRPYFIHVKIDKLIGWQTQAIENVHTLTQVRILESVSEPDTADKFKTVKVDQVRVLELVEGLVEVSLWRKVKGGSGNWALFGEVVRTQVDKIMLTPVYTSYLGFWDAEPPFDDLADVNLAHWRSQSDQTNILHHIRAPMKYIHGYTKDSVNDLKNGGGYVFYSSKDASEVEVGVIEHSSDSSEAGRLDLKELELQMQALGLVLLMEKGQVTATGVNADETKNTSRLGQVADDTKAALEIAIGWLADMSGDPSAAGAVDVNKEFKTVPNDDAASRNLTADWTVGAISHDTMVAEKIRRGIYSANVDAEDERNKILSEGMVNKDEDRGNYELSFRGAGGDALPKN